MLLFSSLVTLASLVIFTSTLASPHDGVAPSRRQNPPLRACENTPTSRQCWGEYNIYTDYYEVVPNTGVIREYWLEAEKITLAPDGYERQVLVFNGSLPGPTIEADWGDEVIVHVKNCIPDNGTAVHWHGIHQVGTNPSDGVPGVTQCPIAPGESGTYRFRATQYGTSWYHSHFTLQFSDGLFGPIVVHGPATANYDVDVGPVVLQDWFHVSAFTVWEQQQRTVPLTQPVADNGLINGLNPYDCSKAKSGSGGGKGYAACVGTTRRFETTFEPGKKYLLRLVGSQTDGFIKFTIDAHNLTVIAADFVPIRPYVTNNVILSSGQRYDVIVEANQQDAASSSYWMRAIYQTACNNNNNDNADNILAVVRYRDADPDVLPDSRVSDGIANSCGDEPYDRLVPWVSHQVGGADTQQQVNLGWYNELDLLADAELLGVGEAGEEEEDDDDEEENHVLWVVHLLTDRAAVVFHWTLRTRTLIVNWSDPTILDIYRNETSFPDNSNVVSIDAPNEWVYWIVQDLTALNMFHPMHLHGHDFYVLAQGRGIFTPGEVALNTNNPPRRDTASLNANGYTVIAFKTNNPGSWVFHCHIAWHASQGLALQLIEREADIPPVVDKVAVEELRTCATWATYYNLPGSHRQDDSGI